MAPLFRHAARLGVLALALGLLPACTTEAIVRRLGATSCVDDESTPATQVLSVAQRGRVIEFRVFYPLGPDRPSGRHDLGRGTILTWGADLRDEGPIRARKLTSEEYRASWDSGDLVDDPAQADRKRGAIWALRKLTPGGEHALLSLGSHAGERWTVEVPNLPGDYWALSVGAHFGLAVAVPLGFAWDVVTLPVQIWFW